MNSNVSDTFLPFIHKSCKKDKLLPFPKIFVVCLFFNLELLVNQDLSFFSGLFDEVYCRARAPTRHCDLTDKTIQSGV